MKELPADLQQAVERRNELVGDVAAMHDLVEEALVVVVLLRGTGTRTACDAQLRRSRASGWRRCAPPRWSGVGAPVGLPQ